MKLSLQIVSSRKDLAGLKGAWNVCVNKSSSDFIHFRHEWFWGGIECFNPDAEPYVLFVRDQQGGPLGIAPLVLARQAYRGIPVRVLAFAKNGQTPFNDFILRQGQEEEILEVMFDHLSSCLCWDLVDLQKIRKDGTLSLALSRSGHLAGCLQGQKENIDSPFVRIEGDWDRFLASRSTRFRKSLRSKMNRVRKAGDLAVRSYRIESGDHPLIEEMFRISGRSWKKEQGTDLQSRDSSQRFYRRVCDSFGPENLVVLWVLFKGEQPVAFEFHLVYRGVCYPIRADYDASFKALSPGSVLEYSLLKRLFEEGAVSEYNSCGHHYAYLLNWTKETREHINVEVFNPSVKGQLLYWLEYRLIPCLRKLHLASAARSVRRWLNYAQV